MTPDAIVAECRARIAERVAHDREVFRAFVAQRDDETRREAVSHAETGDGNGRTARLVEFQILLGAGVPTPAAHLLSNHYNQTRTEYYRQLDRASKSGGDIVPFIEYAARGFVDGLREQLHKIRDQQWDVSWRSYVHEKFRDQSGTNAKRQRDLVLELSTAREPVAVGAAAEVTKLSEPSTQRSP